MTQTRTIIAVMVAAVMVAWGCSKTPTVSPGQIASDSAKPDPKIAKLEADLKAAELTRDIARADLAAARDRATLAQEQTLAVEKERDAIQAGLKAKTAERDVLYSKLEGIQRLLKDALGQSESVLGPAATPTATATTVPVPAPNGL